ncbi:MAG: hypothetical protein ABIJ09_22870 [Pseudomonadota bacterium]
MTGGRNIGIDYLTSVNDRPHAWRDLDVALEGEGPAAALTASFDAELNQVFENDLADPKNGFLEYTIARLPDGRPRVENGKPTPTFGPEDHLPQKVLDEYRGKRKLWGHTLRDNALAFAPLRHPPLEDTI